MSNSKSQKNSKTYLKEQIELLVADLRYPSESDEKIEFFEILDTVAEISTENFKTFIGKSEETAIQTMDLELFFEPLTRSEDWFTDEEAQWAEDALKLKTVLKKKLQDLQVFRVGETEIEVFVIGKTEAGEWIGIKTLLIET
ncbi:nuclease A inhibitor family protein [Arcicella rigui]|uniref:Nuclease A inhibitor family protein n=1 Tax=Arcicella rigui TaxID=797020 RepID=A0ABU5QFA4_9BACT|nr:nuclease A inhibitor family protein [Arcicella rigui]MEA5141529.1 nuclease A inhibitor family protein [Arcicella rigui]